MFKKFLWSTLAVVFSLVLIQSAFAIKGKPSFSPMIYADGEVWGTKAVALLPGPNENNLQSFDKLFIVTNSNNPNGQLPVGEASPSNFMYNGGRWYTHTVTWTQWAFDDLGIVPVLTSYDDIMTYYAMNYLEINPGSPGVIPDYFVCPLLPVKFI